MFNPNFVPPLHNELLFRFAEVGVPRLGRLFGNVYGVSVDPADVERVHSVCSGRALLCPNHPTETDPIVVFWLGVLARRRFNFLATRETLEGPRGFLLNRIGVYSVIRGSADRESIRCTRRLLSEEDRRVVIFPEGLVYEHNDRLLDFQSGPVQMGFWALEDLEKAGREPNLPILPLAIRYQCHANPNPYIDRGLADLERELSLGSDGDRYARLLRIGDTVLQKIERAEGLKPDPALTLSERIIVARRRVLERMAQATGTQLDEEDTPGEQLHALTNALRAWVGVLKEESTDYEERLYRHRSAVAAPLFHELQRLHNFVALTGDYVAADPSAERFLEVLGRLQKEVHGKVRHACPLRAHVGVAEPIHLERRLDDYRAEKRRTVAGVTAEIQDSIRGELARLRESMGV